jgi:hypothetical protein
MIQREATTCLERASLCIETVTDILNSFQMYGIKCSNKFIRLILSFFAHCSLLETDTDPKLLEKWPMLFFLFLLEITSRIAPPPPMYGRPALKRPVYVWHDACVQVVEIKLSLLV